MVTRRLDTQFGPVEVRLHRRFDTAGWLAMLTGRHLVPAPPPLEDRRAETQDEAFRKVAGAIARMVAD